MGILLSYIHSIVHACCALNKRLHVSAHFCGLSFFISRGIVRTPPNCFLRILFGKFLSSSFFSFICFVAILFETIDRQNFGAMIRVTHHQFHGWRRMAKMAACSTGFKNLFSFSFLLRRGSKSQTTSCNILDYCSPCWIFIRSMRLYMLQLELGFQSGSHPQPSGFYKLALTFQCWKTVAQRSWKETHYYSLWHYPFWKWWYTDLFRPQSAAISRRIG